MSRYDKRPVVRISDDATLCTRGWPSIVERLLNPGVVCVECYPGVPVDELIAAFRDSAPGVEVVNSGDFFRRPEAIEEVLAPTLGKDPVFARLDPIGIELFLDDDAVEHWRASRIAGRPTVVVGPGAAHIAARTDVLVHVSMARRELQLRQRRNLVGNLGLQNLDERPAEKYRRAFFVDWRVGDRIKHGLTRDLDFVIETNGRTPQMIDGDTYRAALARCVTRPFRVVPFFDAGPWGGQWMRMRFGLEDGPPNYAWCFDCVPEENSLLLGFGTHEFELPAIDLVFEESRPLLGEQVTARFGAEFPIRFDMLDTMEGGNLSLQVHPQAVYARDAFNLSYTQDESYYLLDAAPDATVYLGLRDSTDPVDFAAALRSAQRGTAVLDVEQFVNHLPARKHDHFLIPAGTVHCSGRNAMVLEISATPYIFTFKLWDWGRLGLDGRPRPIHLEHGLANIDWTRREAFTRGELVNKIEPIDAGAGWRRERTGLHPLEFIETERIWFEATVDLCTDESVNVFNLVEGEAALVESPSGAFEPFEVHYAETFIVPAAVGDFRLRAHAGDRAQCAVIRAFVRKQTE